MNIQLIPMVRLILSLATAVCVATISQCVHAQDLVTTHWNADAKNDILKVGKFDEPSDLKVPDGWQDVSAFDSGNATLERGGRGTLSLNSETDKTVAFIETQIDIPPSAKYLTFMINLRGPTLKRSSQPESGAGVRFTLMKGEVERNFKRVEPSYEGYRSWAFNTQTVQVMPGEDKLLIRVELTKATGSLEIDRILIVPSEITNEATAEQQRLLDQALKTDDAELIKLLVEETPRMLEVRTGNCDNGTPLIRAAWDNAPKAAAMLVKLGADIEAKDPNWGNTPLRWCCWWGVPDVAEVLMQAGAKADGASAMASSSKTNNTFTQHPPQDFDRTVMIIEDHLAKRELQK